MRSNIARFALPALVACVVALSAGTAAAGTRNHDRVYADPYGNLIVHSASGYKRIVVGQGHLAAEMADFTSTADDAVIYLDEPRRHREVAGLRCYTKPGMFKGRSYMYGLPDGVVPTPARRVCR